MSYTSPTLNFLITAVRKTGHNLSRDFSEVERLQNSVKSPVEFVATAYARCERNLRQELSKGKPDFPFWEDNKPEPQGQYFVISPLDGIVNFANGVPYFSISAAIVENGVPLMSVVYNPAADEMYFAEKGRGAFKEGFRNHERLRASAKKDLKKSICSVATSYHKEQSEFFKIFADLSSESENVRIFGAPCLEMAYVASGRLDAVVGLNVLPASIVAGYLLVKEAGGSTRGINQKDVRAEALMEILTDGDVLATNLNLSSIVYSILNK